MKFAAIGLALFASGLVTAQASSNAPQIPSQKMTCRDAQDFYHQHKRIYTIAHGRTLVPLYGFKSVYEARNLYCDPRKSMQPVRVETTDDDTCNVGAFCQG